MNFFLRLLNVGTRHAGSEHGRRFVRNINIATLMSLSGFASFFIIYASVDFANLVPVLFVIAAAFFLTFVSIYLNFIGLYCQASTSLIVILTLGVSLVSFYVENTLQVHFMSLLVAFSSVTIIGFDRIKLVIFFVVVNILAFLAVHNAWIEPTWLAENAEESIYLFRTATIIAIFSVAIILVLVAEYAALTSERALESLAVTDYLTKLYNRRYFVQKVNEEIKRLQRHPGSLAFLLLDIDDFKKINDALGHIAGDEALLEFSGVLTGAVRGYDVCARLGGEEFGILLPNSDEEETVQFAYRLLQKIRDHKSYVSDMDVLMTSSIGIAFYRDGESYESLYKRADDALYKAKHAGKDQFIFAS